MNFIPVLSLEDQKIRTRWLITFLFMIAFTFFNQIYQLSNIPLTNRLIITIQLTSPFVIFGIQYYFIYKKYGTRWLTYNLVITPIANGLILYALITSRFANMAPPLPLSIISMLFALLYLIPCYQLRKINKRIQLERKALKQ